MALKTFYAIVTQFDCSPEQAARYDQQQNGPVLYECYLNEEAANEDLVRKRAEGFAANGWVRVAEVNVDIPGD